MIIPKDRNSTTVEDFIIALYTKLWRACAGPLVTVPREGERMFYFPQGHIEQCMGSIGVFLNHPGAFGTGKSKREIIELQLPSFFNNFDPCAAAANFPSGVQAYLAGLTCVSVASPCSTPVLATLFGYIAESKGIYGYPIQIQALFFFVLRCAQQMLKPEGGGKELIERIDKRITALSFHIQNYYWLDFTQLNNIYRYRTEEYSHTAVNKFNVIPVSIPDWVIDFMPLRGGYFIGNVSPAHMDFRWFLVGNCIAILSSLATPAQATAIMDLIEERWEDLVGEMPLKSLTLHWKDTSGGLSLVVIQRILAGVTIIVELGEFWYGC